MADQLSMARPASPPGLEKPRKSNLERIVVPLGFSDGSKRDLTTAAHFAAHHHLAVHAVSVGGEVADEVRETVTAIDPELSLTFEQFPDSADVHDLVKALTSTFDDADLVVMAADATAYNGEAVAQELAHAWGGPVLMLGPSCRAEKLAPGNVAVALDGSALAERSLPLAHEIAHLLDAPLTLVEVVPTAVSRHVQQMREQGEHASESAYVSDLALRLRDSEVDVSWTIIHDDNPGDGLLAFLEKHNTSILVMATHGYGGLPRPAFGTTSSRMVKEAEVPVLALRPTSVAVTALTSTQWGGPLW